MYVYLLLLLFLKAIPIAIPNLFFTKSTTSDSDMIRIISCRPLRNPRPNYIPDLKAFTGYLYLFTFHQCCPEGFDRWPFMVPRYPFQSGRTLTWTEAHDLMHTSLLGYISKGLTLQSELITTPISRRCSNVLALSLSVFVAAFMLQPLSFYLVSTRTEERLSAGRPR